MTISMRNFAAAGAGMVLGLAVAGVACTQPELAPPPPASEGPVAPIFAGPPPPTDVPGVALPRRPATLHEREDALDALLDSELADGSIDKDVGARARLELDSIRFTEDRLRSHNHGVLTDADAFALDARLRKVGGIIRGHPSGEP